MGLLGWIKDFLWCGEEDLYIRRAQEVSGSEVFDTRDYPEDDKEDFFEEYGDLAEEDDDYDEDEDEDEDDFEDDEDDVDYKDEEEE